MSYKKISELPKLTVDELVNGDEFAVMDYTNVARRVNISENLFDTEQEAIDRVIEIYRTGKRAFILPYK